MAEEKKIYVFAGPGLGSVQHYHHFLFALLVPLLNQWNKLMESAPSAQLFVQSCGPFDRVLKELALPGVKILPQKPHQKKKLIEAAAEGKGDGSVVILKRHDFPRTYRRQAYSEARNLLAFRYADRIKAYRDEIGASFKPGSPRILFINRGEADKFYASQASEVKSAGTERRSIPNFDELATALTEKFGNVLAMTLESKSLLYQIALFSSVDLIVCQHGAALANLIWAKPGARVIEIMPDDIAESHAYNAFGRLVPCVSMDYWRLPQDSSHARIEPDALLEIVETSLSGRLPGAELRPDFDTKVTFTPEAAANAWLREGWLEPTKLGAWSVGPVATLRLPPLEVTAPKLRLVAFVRAALSAGHQRHDARVMFNGTFVGNWGFRHDANGPQRAVDIPAEIVNRTAANEVEFQFADCRSLAELGLSKDDRELGFILSGLKLREITASETA